MSKKRGKSKPSGQDEMIVSAPGDAPAPEADTPLEPNLDPVEVKRFSDLSAEWWNPSGKFKPLHKFNPVRVEYIRDSMARHFARDTQSSRPFEGLKVLDIGCGGGLLCEPLARLGAEVTGLDPSRANIDAAVKHSQQSGLDISYRVATAEGLAQKAEQFDMVLAMEVIEHVPDPEAFVKTCTRLVRPGGLLLVSTINRTLKALALAIIGAEYVLRWLPRGTHHYDRLVTPEEILRPLEREGFRLVELQGVTYNPLFMRWSLSTNTDVNYMALATRTLNQAI